MSEGERLQKVLARAGIAARRQAEALISSGRVTVNGQVVSELGARVDPTQDQVAVDGTLLPTRPELIYLALHKPYGYVTTARDEKGRRTVMELVPKIPGLFPVGRLDAASTGLLLLTTDGEWAQRIAHPSHGSEKEYLVEVRGRPDEETLSTLHEPMDLGHGDHTTGAQVDLVETDGDRSTLKIVLHEGRNRQIRRMMEQVGHPVTRLHRVRVGNILLGDLPPRRWRRLTTAEIGDGAATPGPRDPGYTYEAGSSRLPDGNQPGAPFRGLRTTSRAPSGPGAKSPTHQPQGKSPPRPGRTTSTIRLRRRAS